MRAATTASGSASTARVAGRAAAAVATGAGLSTGCRGHPSEVRIGTCMLHMPCTCMRLITH